LIVTSSAKTTPENNRIDTKKSKVFFIAFSSYALIGLYLTHPLIAAVPDILQKGPTEV
jgi:hypothetical protein